MKTLASKLALTTLALATVGVAHAQSMEVSFRPEKSRYARGETFTLVLTARDAAGRRMPNAFVYFLEGPRDPEEHGIIGSGWTNAAGEIAMTYRVPTNPNFDNVYVGGLMPLSGSWQTWPHPMRRIPIGR